MPNFQPIYPWPRPKQRIFCIRCGRDGAMVADLDGEPFKAFYHDVCVPLEHQEAVRRALIREAPRG